MLYFPRFVVEKSYFPFTFRSLKGEKDGHSSDKSFDCLKMTDMIHVKSSVK